MALIIIYQPSAHDHHSTWGQIEKWETLLSVTGSLQWTGGNKAEIFHWLTYRITYPQSLEINSKEVNRMLAKGSVP